MQEERKNPKKKSSRLLIGIRRPPRDPRRRRLRPRYINRPLLLNLLLPRDPGPPIQSQRGDDVEDDIRPHDAEIAPSVRVGRADGSQVGVGF